ncbi:sensor histidine kinase [Paracnuella aquatica]|uniref:sensor histidine kinase n=1 Tax=Paracnuella aquatica TaxID=2268757 RepID=UPI000F5092AB|nr:HAMP domain-containing sensor histidine kinase [Paracnuella aquatica]RPD45128.1 sensor histidine kinase [Paracnuella aquatica]
MTPAHQPFMATTPKRYLLWAALLLFVLSFISGTYFRSKPPANLEQKKLEHYLERQQVAFGRLLADTPLVRRLAQKAETQKDMERLQRLPFAVFFYADVPSGQELLFWNTQDVMPASPNLAMVESTGMYRLANGHYLVQKKRLELPGLAYKVQAYALILVQYKYNVQSDYLVNHFAHDKETHTKFEVAPEPTEFPVKTKGGQTLFYLTRKAFTPEAETDGITFCLRLGSLVLLLVYLHLVAGSIARRRGALQGVALLSGSLLVARLIFYQFPGVFNFNQYSLFGPGIYASSALNPSLGDLFINVTFFCWLSIFAWLHTGANKEMPPYLRGWRRYVVGAAALMLLVLATFEVANVVRSLVADSQISFQVTDFFSLSRYTVVGFVVLAMLSLGYYFFSRVLFRFIMPAFAPHNYLIYFSLALVGLVWLTLLPGQTPVSFHIPVLGWLLLFTFFFSRQQSFINHFKVTLAGVLFWIFIFSASLAAIILQENKEKQWAHMEAFAQRLDNRTDPTQERTVSLALTYMDERFFTRNYHRFMVPRVNSHLRDSIAIDNFHPTYRQAYKTQLYAFDSAKNPLYNEDGRTYDELENIYTLRSKATSIPNLNYYEPEYEQVVYLAKREVRDSAGLLGTFFILSIPKRYVSDNFLPELFSNKNRQDIEGSPLYSYAVYNRGILRQSSNIYSFKTSVTAADKPVRNVEYRQNGPYNELWYKASTTKMVVIAKKRDTWLESITLFSYLFCSFLLMVAVLQLIAILLRAIYGWRVVNLFSEVSIRAQVHGTIIFISLLSFLIIGVATITFFVERYNRENEERVSRTSVVIRDEIDRRLKGVAPLDSILNGNDTVRNAILSRIVDDLAQVHSLNVNLFDVQGRLRFTSIGLIYSQGLLSEKIDPMAYYHMSRMRQVQYTQRETIGTLNYLSLYTAVQEPRFGVVQGYLNIPYFGSQLDLKREISNFLVTIINLNAFIFLIAGVIALFITNRISRSFSVIGEKMKAITLGKTNEEIEWNRKDEIGELVTQYNKMVHQLEASAEALARSEREGAWREMARQVAHEIKNPLTPMKLSIQYLQKAISAGHPNVQDLTTRVANTLVEQIDHLSKIAADFSRFANIGHAQVELFDLHDVLDGLTHLFESNPKVELQWQPVAGPVWISADKTHINRLFTNLLTNAVEACGSADICLVELVEVRTDEGIEVQVRDNGEGIAADMQQKIFTPNFTTKSSGTGLGLAMCKGIVEQAGGRIWFQTEEGVGTTFFVALPVGTEE